MVLRGFLFTNEDFSIRSERREKWCVENIKLKCERKGFFYSQQSLRLEQS